MEHKDEDEVFIFGEEIKVHNSFHLVLLTNDEQFDTR